MEGFCKACLMKHEDPSQLLHYTEKNRRLYLYSTGLQVKPDDVFPFQICQTCFTTMTIACKFKKQCRSSDKRLNNFLSLKEVGEETDFCKYLQKTEGSMLFRFPVNCATTPSSRKAKEDDNVSTSTSIRNFMTDFLRDDEIPDTEARMIREMIEREADVLDDSLDSQWLQDDISIASDFRFSPYSTPLSKSNHQPLNYTPVKEEPKDEQEQTKNTTSESTGRRNILAAKKLLLNSKSSTSENETSSIASSQLSTNKNNFIAAKKMLLNSKTDSDTSSNGFTGCWLQPANQESYIAAKRILLNSKSKSTESEDEIKPNQTPMDMETYLATKSILLNSNSNQDGKSIAAKSPSSDIVPNYDVAESVTYDSIDGSDSASVRKGFYVENAEAEENNVDIRIIDDEKRDCIERNIEKALNNTNDEVISLSALLASPSSESVRGATPQNNIIATPSVHQGLSGANTPSIANILFGETLDNNQIRPDYDMKDAKSEGSEDNVLKDFFDKETGKYISEEKEEPKEIFEEFEHPKIHELMPSKCKFDLTDFSCKMCDLRYKSERGLKIHFAKTHNMKIICQRQKEQRVEMPCDHCGKIFSLRSNLSKHIKVMHKAPKLAQTCNVCGLTYASEGRLRIHMKSHSGIKYQARPDKKKNLMCNICGHVSSQRSNLATHMARHNKTYSYTCDPCGKGFYRKTDLAIHMRIHMGIKPFRCSQCSAGFTRKDQLRNHLLTHTEERPFICTNCDHKFASAAKLRYHMKHSVTCERKRIADDLEANKIIEERIDQFFVTEKLVASEDLAENLVSPENVLETGNKPLTPGNVAEKSKILHNASETGNQPVKVTKQIGENVINKKSELKPDVEMEHLTKSVKIETLKSVENKTLKLVKNKTPKPMQNKTPKSVKAKTPMLVENKTEILVENKETSVHSPDDDKMSISDIITIPTKRTMPFIIETDRIV